MIFKQLKFNVFYWRVHDEEVIATHEHINSEIVGSIDQDSLKRRRISNEENMQLVEDLDSNETQSKHDKSLVKCLKVIYDNIDQIRYKVQIDTYNSCKDNEWLLVGVLIDKILFFVYCIIVITSTLTIFKR